MNKGKKNQVFDIFSYINRFKHNVHILKQDIYEGIFIDMYKSETQINLKINIIIIKYSINKNNTFYLYFSELNYDNPSFSFYFLSSKRK